MRHQLSLLVILFFLTSYKAQLPDFKTGITFSYGYDQANKELNLTWDFFNVGGATSNSFTIAYIASLDMNIGPEDYLIDSKSYASAVTNAFATLTFTYGFAPDDLPSGLYNLVVYLDYGNKIQESNENNNIISFGKFNFVNTTTGIGNVATKADFGVFPNPAYDEVTLDLKNNLAIKDLNYKLYSIAGQEVLVDQMKQDMITNEKKISVKGLPSGIYFLHLKTSNTTLIIRKLIVR